MGDLIYRLDFDAFRVDVWPCLAHVARTSGSTRCGLAGIPRREGSDLVRGQERRVLEPSKGERTQPLNPGSEIFGGLNEAREEPSAGFGRRPDRCRRGAGCRSAGQEGSAC